MESEGRNGKGGRGGVRERGICSMKLMVIDAPVHAKRIHNVRSSLHLQFKCRYRTFTWNDSPNADQKP